MAIDNEVLSQRVSAELDNAATWMEADLADQQADNLKYYHAEPFGNEKTGHSQVVTRDVMETIEGIMPELMKIFSSSDSVVEFEPVGPEDEEAAGQATEYVNYVFMKRLNGFKLLYNWFKDSLLMKNSVIKVGWASEDKVEFHNFDGLNDEQLTILEDEEEIEVLEKEKNEDGLTDVKVRRIVKGGEPYIEHIPSEEFRIKERSKDICSADFTGHVTTKTVGELLEAGFDMDQLEMAAASFGTTDTQIADARFSDPEEGSSLNMVTSPVDEDKELEVADVYIRTYDEDEERVVLINVIQVGNEILFQEEVSHAPLINLSPIMMPHRFTGVAEADLVKDIQEIRSTLYRQALDNLALQNAGRYVAVEGQVNLQDLLDNKIGGVTRVKSLGALSRQDTPQLSPLTFPMLENLDLQRENRTGVSRMTQGLDPNALTSNTAATAVNQIMTAAQSKILLIARIFAETGVKELMWELYHQIRTHQTSADIVKLRGRYVVVNPFDWTDRKDMTVTVGIGNGNKDQQLYHLNNISQMMQQVGSSPYGYLITAENVHSLAKEFIKNGGYKNAERFISDPATTQPPPPQPSAEMVAAQGEAAKDQADAALKQQQLQLDVAKQQLEREKFDWQKRVEAAELAVEAEQDRPVGIGDK